MSHVALSIIGALLVLITIILTYSVFGLLFGSTSLVPQFLTFFFLVIIILEFIAFLSSSSAAPPACLDGFIVETNGGTGEAYTCTPLDL